MCAIRRWTAIYIFAPLYGTYWNLSKNTYIQKLSALYSCISHLSIKGSWFSVAQLLWKLIYEWLRGMALLLSWYVLIYLLSCTMLFNEDPPHTPSPAAFILDDKQKTRGVGVEGCIVFQILKTKYHHIMLKSVIFRNLLICLFGR